MFADRSKSPLKQWHVEDVARSERIRSISPPKAQDVPTENRTGANARCVLVVGDDRAMQNTIADYFIENNMPTRSVADRHDLKRLLSMRHASAVILDLSAWQGCGLALIQEIRSTSDIPIILMSTRGHDEIDCIIGLELGADGYVAKPPSLRELLARSRAILRRYEMAATSQMRDPERAGYRFNGWTLDSRFRLLRDPYSNPVSLTKREYGLLLAFLKAPGRPLTRESLLQATRVHEDIFDRSVDVQILRLRRKLQVDSSASPLIETARGVGYVFVGTVEPL